MHEAWSEDPEAFETHFGLSYGDFHVLLQALPPDVRKKYDRTLAVDEEAAIIFAMHKGKKLGLLKDDESDSGSEENTPSGSATGSGRFRVFERVGDGGWHLATRHNDRASAVTAADEIVREWRGSRTDQSKRAAVIVHEAPHTGRPAGRIHHEENTEGVPALPYRFQTMP